MPRRFLFGASFTILGFALGLATPRLIPAPTSPVAPSVPESAQIPVDAAPADRTCRNALTSAKAQLAICLAFRASPESSAPMPPPSPTAMMPGETESEETARLVRANTEAVVVRRPDGSIRVYGPGEWPPPGGPGIGSQVIARKLPNDAGIEWYSDGGTRVVPANRALFSPEVLRTLDGGARPPAEQ